MPQCARAAGDTAQTCVSKALLPQAVGDEAVAACMEGSRGRQPVNARHRVSHLHGHTCSSPTLRSQAEPRLLSPPQVVGPPRLPSRPRMHDL